MAIIVSNITGDPFAVGSLSILSVAWLISFIGAIAADVDGPFPRFSWWGIIWQLITNTVIAVLYLTDTVHLYDNLVTGMLAIAFVYTTNTTNHLVYSTRPALLACAAGSVLLSMINVLWLLYFASDPSSPTSQWIDSFSQTQRSGRFPNDQPAVTQKMMTENSANPFGYGAALHQPYLASSTQLNGLENGEEPSGQGYYSSTAAAINTNNDLSDHDLDEIEEDEDGEESYPYTVKALYDYQANPADATELSFSKGEVLKVQSIDGRWWQAKNADGKVGILPSNYVEKVDG